MGSFWRKLVMFSAPRYRLQVCQYLVTCAISCGYHVRGLGFLYPPPRSPVATKPSGMRPTPLNCAVTSNCQVFLGV